eukprot:4932162-Amphidinium_carterae.1
MSGLVVQVNERHAVDLLDVDVLVGVNKLRRSRCDVGVDLGELCRRYICLREKAAVVSKLICAGTRNGMGIVTTAATQVVTIRSDVDNSDGVVVRVMVTRNTSWLIVAVVVVVALVVVADAVVVGY